MKLSDLIEIIGGGTPKTSVNEYWNGSIPWLSVKDFNNDERYVYETEKCITEEGLAHSSTKLLQKDDIIISARGTVGEIAMIPFPMSFNQSCYGIRGKKHLIDNTYLYYLIKNSIKSLKKITHGSVFDTITRDTFKNIEVNIPSINLQIKIAEILSTLDDKIELNNQINKNLEQQAQAIFKSWLKNSKSTIKIGDMAQNILDYTPSKHKKVILINSSDVTNGNFNHHSLSENSNLKGHFKKRFKKYDILYSEIRPKNHHYAYCQFDPENYIASTRLMIIRNKSEYISSSLLYQYIMLNKVFNEFTLKTETRSGTFPQGRYEDIAAIQVPYKIIEEQKDITAILDNFYEIIWLNQKENFNLTNIRDTLLPKLMNGEIDVSEINL